MASAIYFLYYCSWGIPSSAFIWWGEPALGNARSSNSRGRLSLNSKPDDRRMSTQKCRRFLKNFPNARPPGHLVSLDSFTPLDIRYLSFGKAFFPNALLD